MIIDEIGYTSDYVENICKIVNYKKIINNNKKIQWIKFNRIIKQQNKETKLKNVIHPLQNLANILGDDFYNVNFSINLQDIKIY